MHTYSYMSGASKVMPTKCVDRVPPVRRCGLAVVLQLTKPPSFWIAYTKIYYKGYYTIVHVQFNYNYYTVSVLFKCGKVKELSFEKWCQQSASIEYHLSAVVA